MTVIVSVYTHNKEPVVKCRYDINSDVNPQVICLFWTFKMRSSKEPTVDFLLCNYNKLFEILTIWDVISIPVFQVSVCYSISGAAEPSTRGHCNVNQKNRQAECLCFSLFLHRFISMVDSYFIYIFSTFVYIHLQTVEKQK